MQASRRHQPHILLVFAFVIVGLPAVAEVGRAQQDAGTWTIDDILFTESAGQYQISPDGRWVVWVKSTMDATEGRQVSNLYLSSLTSDLEIQLTRGNYSHSSPRWTPSGELISFMSSRPLPRNDGDAAASQLWSINPAGGEPWPLTSFERRIRSYEWKDGDTIVFTAEEDPTLYERETERRDDTSRVVEDTDHAPPVRIFAFSVKDKKVTRLTDNADWIRSFELSPDGRRAVAVHSRSLSYGYDGRVAPVTYLWDLDVGVGRQVFDGSRVIPGNVQWSKDGSGFYLVNDSTTHPRYRTATIDVLMYYDLAIGEATLVDLEWDRGLGFDYAVTSDGFVALLENGVHLTPARYRRRGSGWRRELIEGRHVGNIWGFELGADERTLVYSYSTANSPAQLYRGQLRGSRIRNEEQLTNLNPSFAVKPKPRVEIVHWVGARNEAVEGLLYYPLEYEEGRRYPLTLVIHGGPASADRDSWSMTYSRPVVLLNQRGTFVLRANYHGSSSYGLDWVESICCGELYSLATVDLESGVDYLIGRGLVDPERLGTLGWSYGAILSIELTTRNPRYRVASTGAGDVEWINDWANVDFGHSYDDYYLGAVPYEDPQRYIELSPFFRMEDVQTPTIIYFGTEDRNVPTDQGWSHFRALQQIGRVPVKFILFPGETHSIGKLAHQRRKVEEDLAWFDMYLFGTYEPKNEALKDGSPLAEALKGVGIARSDGRYGRLQHGTLLPELVEYMGLEIGRFEVTRAQYGEFDRSYAYEPGTEDYPASGITFGAATAYVEWLSRRTGEPYRLGTAEEMEAVYESARGAENTLDYWAGYTANPDDAARLRERIAELPGPAPLLKAVASFRSCGDEVLVFDLGGNVAEWVVGAGGEGELMGGSADQPADAKGRDTQAAEGYRGFRVVRGGTNQ
ncbi:MAG: prolyl oligopeptidase family serine peptidase [Gemmatimonadales bacterium]|jgi:dipeptidyl aminopeptidase/acylaminoacyl peptidase